MHGRRRVVIAIDVRDTLERASIRYALIGAKAIALRAEPRFTQDTDFLVTDYRVFQPSVWEHFTAREIPVDIRKGDYDDPLAGVVRIGTSAERVDVVVGRTWERDVIDRAELLTSPLGERTPVATRSDLILLKLAAGGYKDLVDAHNLLTTGSVDTVLVEVEANIHKLPKDAQREWAKLIAHPR
jgi:hypothetical protein